LPNILNYKQAKLAQESPTCLLQAVSLDLSNQEQRDRLFSQINAEAKKVLIITEGLLVHLMEKQLNRIGQLKEILNNPAQLSGENVLPGFILDLARIL
jgi:O-methyltransferase involved in polyketide biosynthesis